MDYDKFTYIFPPRTNMKIPPGPGVVRNIWSAFPDVVGQFKLNGTRNTFYVFPDGRVECWGRHAEQQKLYTLTPSMAAQIESLELPRGKFHVLDGELLHSKTKDIKDVSYVFDILVHNGKYLLGQNYRERYDLLFRLLKGRYYPLNFTPKEGEMYLAENFSPDRWEWMWQAGLHTPHCEGLVLKRTGPISMLQPGRKEINNESFMMRIRKPHKNYRQ